MIENNKIPPEVSPAVCESKFTSFRKSFWGEVIQIVLISLAIVIPFRAYVAQPFLVSGTSMDNTFANGQYLIVDEITYNFSKPNRGDVVIFRPPIDMSKFFIKRVIGLPGEKVQVKNDIVKIFNTAHPDGFVLDEPYAKIDKLLPHRADAEITLQADQYYVMGDNRFVSEDSRIFGPITSEVIAGRPILRLWPLSTINWLPGQSTSTVK